MSMAAAARIALGVLLAGGVAAGLYYGHSWNGVDLAAAGEAAPMLFVAAYALATVLFVPGSALTLAGGALFGPVAGTFYSLTGATLGATLAFLVARYLARDWVARRASGKLSRFVRGVEAEGWRFVAFVRLVPLLPFNLLNYALGLTGIPLWQYVAASYIAMLPGAAAYTYIGYAGREVLAGTQGLVSNGLVALALIAATLFLPRLARRLRKQPAAVVEARALEQRLGRRERLTLVDVRGADEYRGELGHIPGALNIPLAGLPARLAELRALERDPVVLVCRTDKRSAKAAELLRSAGFRGVEVLRGGMEQWNRLGFPVERRCDGVS